MQDFENYLKNLALMHVTDDNIHSRIFAFHKYVCSSMLNLIFDQRSSGPSERELCVKRRLHDH